MKDILLDKDGDIKLNDAGDITLADSVIQAVLIRIRWFAGEWIFAPVCGLPWYEEFLIKNPNTEYMKNRLIREMKQVDHVLDVSMLQIVAMPQERCALIKFTVQTEEGQYSEEVRLNE